MSARAVIDLGARASILDAVDRVRSADGAEELVLSVAAGAPVLRNPVFLEVLRRESGARRIALVTPDPRARSFAAAVHMPAFASVAALERHELDATESLGPARRAAIVATQPPVASPLRRIGVFGAVLGAFLVLFAILAPTATVVVAPVAEPLGPLEYDLRAGPNNADINALTLGPASISAKLTGTATGTRTEEAKAAGVARFTNQTTTDIRIAKGTILQTSDNIRFQTTSDKTLPRSNIVIFPPSVNFGTVDVDIEALEAGPKGNVGANKITQSSPSSTQYSVTNPSPTVGGDSKTYPVIQLSDYQAAAARADTELRKQADAKVEEWKKTTKDSVYGSVISNPQVAPVAIDLVGKDAAAGGSFELTATATATGYSVPTTEPKTAGIKKITQEVKPGFDIDQDAAVVDPVTGPTIQSDGVHWRVRVRASQFRRVDDAAIRTALAGRPLDLAEITSVVQAYGVEFRRALSWPGWWPRMPVLDSRIQVTKEAPAAVTPP